MGNKKFIFISLLILAIGFAAVSTTLYITGNVAYQTKKNNFDVYFSGAEIDHVDLSNIVIKDKKHIEYTSNELKKINDTSVLKYEVTNDSTEYDATVTISCTPMKTAYFDVTLNPVTFDIDAGEVKTGEIEAKLTSVSEIEQNISIDCELSAVAKERTSIETILEKNDNYAISGVLKDGENNLLTKTDLVIYSNTPHLVKSDKKGYFYVDNLERGIHEIYLATKGIDINDKEAIAENSSFGATLTTNNVYKVIKGDYKIEDINIGHDIENNSVYCEFDLGKVWDFPYNGTSGSDGSEQFLDVKEMCDGTYKLEVWGAQGGTYSTAIGGYGGYSEGLLHLEEGQKLYIHVGGAGYSDGNHSYKNGGYNGGGDSPTDSDGNTRNASGGGATHMSFDKGLLSTLSGKTSNIVIVAGGGGGYGYNYVTCGNKVATGTSYSGGGYIGGGKASSCGDWGTCAGGGTQNAGGLYYSSNCSGKYCVAGSFGKGAAGYYAGSGGGYYGGAVAWWLGAGGSGYIGYEKLKEKAMYCYNCQINDGLTNENYKTIKTTSDDTTLNKDNCPLGYSSSAISRCAKSGHGHARITLVSLH